MGGGGDGGSGGADVSGDGRYVGGETAGGTEGLLVLGNGSGGEGNAGSPVTFLPCAGMLFGSDEGGSGGVPPWWLAFCTVLGAVGLAGSDGWVEYGLELFKLGLFNMLLLGNTVTFWLLGCPIPVRTWRGLCGVPVVLYEALAGVRELAVFGVVPDWP